MVSMTNKATDEMHPMAKEATAPKAPPSVNKIQEKQKVKAEEKVAESKGKPTLAELVKSNQKRTLRLAVEKDKRNK